MNETQLDACLARYHWQRYLGTQDPEEVEAELLCDGATMLETYPFLGIQGAGGIAAADVKHMLPFMPHYKYSVGIHRSLDRVSSRSHHISEFTTRETDMSFNDPSLCVLLR